MTRGPAYPNPFNPTTRIPFGIPAAGRVRVVVYDLFGRAVQVVLEQSLEPGVYVGIVQGASLAGGVYFVRLAAGSVRAVQKIVLLK